MIVLGLGAITSFTACSGGETKNETTTDSATYQDTAALVPAPADTTHVMTDTSMKDTTQKKP